MKNMNYIKLKACQRRTIVSFLLAFVFAITLSGQSATEEKIQNISHYAAMHPAEKVYLHFDNTSYYLGETIWYKAYVTLPETHVLSDISKVLHVEVRNQYGQEVERQAVRIGKGMACGQIELPVNNLPGYYEVRAYTKWMLNRGENNCFSRVFPFYPAPAVPGEYKKELIKFRINPSMKTRPGSKEIKREMTFYPEGGHLVKDVPVKVAFRFRTEDELFPVLDTVRVYTSDDRLLTIARTRHDGMGEFRYLPSDKPGYVRFSHKGKNYKYKLPEAEEKGVCLSVPQQSEDSILVRIDRKRQQADTLFLCLLSYGNVHEVVRIETAQPLVRLKFPLHILPCGVAQALLLLPDGTPLGQRMFFVNRPEKYIRIHCEQNRDIYKPGERVALTFHTADAGYPKGCSTTFSLAVRATEHTDLNALADNVRTNLLLSSELKGYIHQPEYYFLPSGEIRSKELDLLMLVQGWSMFDWSRMSTLTGNVRPVHFPEQDLLLSGQLKTNLFKQKLADTEVNMLLKDTSFVDVMTARTDSNVFFHFPLMGIQERCPAILKALNKKGKDRKCRFLLDRDFSPPLRSYEMEEMLPLWEDIAVADSVRIDSIRTMGRQKSQEQMIRDGVLLDEVVIKKKRNRLPLKQYDYSLAAYYDIERMVEEHLDKGKRYVSFADFLLNTDINFRWNKKQDVGSGEAESDTLKYGNSEIAPSNTLPKILYKDKNAWWIVDGIIVGSNVTLNRLLMEKPQGLKSLIINEGSMAARYIQEAILRENSGITNSMTTDTDKAYLLKRLRKTVGNIVCISLTTAHGLDFHFRYPRSSTTRVIYLDGFVRPKAFYSPDYSDLSLPENKDHRRTLYWNPSVQTDKKGNATVTFYNSDKYTTLNVNAETVTPEGKLGSMNVK